MIPSLRGGGLGQWCVLGLLGLVLGAAPARAGWLGFRNDTESPLLIQINNVDRSGKAQLLYPGEVAWTCVVQPAPKVIRIYQAKLPRRLLREDKVFCGQEDLFFSVRFDHSSPESLIATSQTSPGRPGR
ncbi:MAG: hypothetical protein JO112_00310 [Planctomycetes bacterium]|nr:hypothetical protein [Planctomycetota bacterium]